MSEEQPQNGQPSEGGSKDERLGLYLAGKLSEEDRHLFEEELLRSSQLSADTYDELTVRDALNEAVRLRAARERNLRSESRASRRSRRAGWRIPRWAIFPAAAAVLLVAVTTVWRLGGPETPPTFRGGEADLQALDPVGGQPAAPTRFTWTSDPAASRYRFELFDAESRMVTSRITADTTLATDDLSSAPSSGYWQVTSLDEMNVAGPGSGPVWYHIEE